MIKYTISIRDKFDILYLYSPHNIYQNWLVSLGFKGKIIYHTQDFLDQNQYVIKTLIEKKLMKKADINITNEENRGIFLKYLYNLEKLPLTIKTTLPKEFPFKKFSIEKRKNILKKFNLNENNFHSYKLIFHIGGYNEKRLTENIIEALSLLNNEYLLFFTNSKEKSFSEKKLKELSVKYDVVDRVFLFGKLPEQELFDIIPQMDLGLLLYPDNDIGNIYQSPGRLSEYLGSGLKVIVPNYPALDCLINKHNFGETCDPKFVNSICNSILKSLKNFSEKDREKLIINFFENYTYEDDFIKFIKLIKKEEKK